MKMLDLFSGIGGFSLAAEWAGIETAAFCEQDLFCQRVLNKHWPSVPIADDIFKMRGDQFGPVDIVSGGFPCQPFSLAGKRKGTDDDRHLWPEMFRIIKEARPTWVLGENVAGIINLALKGVLSDLESVGYQTQCFVIPACAVDAPHRRDRVWIVAHAIRKQDHRERGNNKCRWNAMGWEAEAAQQNHGQANTNGVGGQSKTLANPVQPGLPGRHSGENRKRSYVKSSRKNSGLEWETWAIESGLGGMVDGIPGWLDGYWPEEPEGIPRVGIKIPNRAARLKALGNAIVPQVVFMIFKYIMEIERMNHA